LPRIYEAFQRALGGHGSRQKLVDGFIGHQQGVRVLDLGCGSGAILPYLGKVSYVGIDLNAAHIARARNRYGDRGCFHSGDFASLKSETAGTFDLELCLGLLHHLDDRRVEELGRLAHAYLAPAARFLAVDLVFTEDQPWIARLLAAARLRPERAHGGCLSFADRHGFWHLRYLRVARSAAHSLFTLHYAGGAARSSARRRGFGSRRHGSPQCGLRCRTQRLPWVGGKPILRFRRPNAAKLRRVGLFPVGNSGIQPRRDKKGWC
jgi:SAM-dependent methyltransferase